MFTVESKSQLARLMANENILVEHRNVPTAGFLLDKRTLICPIWKDMSGHLYDLLLGHEVGHALETPEEGWHDAVVSDTRPNFKNFLNVVEDVRIEKKIKRRYPGLRNSFVTAYRELFERDFFGLEKRNIQKSYLIDRINVHFKLGSNIVIEFTPEEQKYVDMVENCETWKDVVAAAEALYNYSKIEQNKTPSSETDKFSLSDEEGDGEESDNFSFDESEDETECESLQSKDSDSDEESDENVEEDGSKINRDKESQPSTESPRCLSDEEFRKRETELLDEKSKPYIYANIPKPILKNIIVSAKECNEEISKYFKEQYFYSPAEKNITSEKLLTDFKNNNERYISMLAKEFEMRKAANSFSKRRVSETGDIDISKMYRYKLDDNIFRKMMHVPKGKSHGLVMLLDKSGSMQRNMAGAIEQILVLASFCRKVNIPFVAYGFTNNSRSVENIEPCFSTEVGEIGMRHLKLREMISSKMKSSEFTESMKNLLRVKFQHELQSASLPEGEGLSNTPLNEALVAVKPLIEEHKRNFNLDIVNLIIVHDGDSDTNSYVNKSVGFSQDSDVFIKDPQSKLQIKLEKSNRGLTVALMEYITKTTGAKVLGFFIVERSRDIRTALYNYYRCNEGGSFKYKIGKYYNDENKLYELNLKIRKEKFIESYTTGYNRFFIIPGGKDLKIDDENVTIEGKVTAMKLASAFKKVNKKRHVSRMLVNRFIDIIAKH
jgi:hypothetical protein